MIIVLYITGIITLVISIVVGFYSGSFIGFLVSVAGGFTSAIILFSLSKILENQDTILYTLAKQEEVQKRYLFKEKQICSRCSKEYDIDFGSCPYCGHRE